MFLQLAAFLPIIPKFLNWKSPRNTFENLRLRENRHRESHTRLSGVNEFLSTISRFMVQSG